MWGRPAYGSHRSAPPRYVIFHRLKDQIYVVAQGRFDPRIQI
jgi:hypothetical protein